MLWKTFCILEYLLGRSNSIAIKKEDYWDGGSSLYYYKDFKMTVCHRYTENGNINSDIIIGKDFNVGEVCS